MRMCAICVCVPFMASSSLEAPKEQGPSSIALVRPSQSACLVPAHRAQSFVQSRSGLVQSASVVLYSSMLPPRAEVQTTAVGQCQTNTPLLPIPC